MFHPPAQEACPASLRPRILSHTARDNVAIKLSLDADEDDAVPCGIAFVPFNLVVGHGDFRPVRNLAFAVRDDRNVMAAFDLEDVGLVCVRCSLQHDTMGLSGRLSP